ncbi:two-component regulator propeller domain-containing protein [Candidatus Venteria ishoeyi]|uniref:Two component regulator propeller n=1 Tax=Candidatus Venteria ishoeyi TaxID=1899563 RepID=A0A1H6F4G8_9GAMM|nr:two-component regulator propeller domain-containing protein [Candidatus Venteria ishoeyi]SEH04271.1 Two component regulator propeller [Candidatus Venteria ishoeyi]
MLKLLCLFVLCFSGQAFALSFEPAAPLVEVNGQIAISVQGVQGEVIWSVNKGRIEGNGNLATFFAPSEDGIATVLAVDGSGNFESLRVTVAKGEEVAGGVSLDNAQWELFTNRNDINALLLSDDGETLWVGTDGGLEQRNASSGELLRVYTKLDGLPANGIKHLISDGSGGLWIHNNTGAGLARLGADGQWFIYTSDNSDLPDNHISALLSDDEGGIWIATSRGLAHLFADGHWRIFHAGKNWNNGC